ncbi:hypothetical protein [Parageobacillus toebii]|jgi:hypothetical protein|uniref:hypothetical protein n=1 Tax=Parageobacillus toebii TaxID=153151 RepID=UPI001967A7BD|nr:hypothetical protein [Parageobacillus toebii]QSB48759.1 hypothetical protein JTI59_17115 [Parageobacillus toebii]
MIYIEVDENGLVKFTHYKPFDEKDGLGKTEEELRQTGYLVESIPEQENIPNKVPVLKFDKNSEEFYYEYVDRPLTTEEKLELMEQENQGLKNRIEIMQQALDDLILGGM